MLAFPVPLSDMNANTKFSLSPIIYVELYERPIFDALLEVYYCLIYDM